MESKSKLKYTKVKKTDFKGWLLGSKSKVYAGILIGFLVALLLVFIGLSSMDDNEEDETINTTTESFAEENTTQYIEKNQSYMLKINRANNFLTVYKYGADGKYSIVETVFRCSINKNIPVGETTITEKSIWRKLDERLYVQYASKLANGIWLHSVPYRTQDIYDINVDAYNNLGKDTTLGFVYMQASDAKWIYDNCGTNVSVMIYDDFNEVPPVKLGEFETISYNYGYDPSDYEILKNNVSTKIKYMAGTDDDRTIQVGEYFDPMKDVYAIDVDGNDISSYIRISGSVNTSVPGTYRLIYYLSDQFGTDLAYYRYITVE